ncbi:helix-turn-helix domain-containing protein [Planotetraspora phitsanulokensis]|uniref:TetR family transcriptional regulator n=1 Tax=Planotetraspora phitsanulokensis TaxID=575192 RepID=A0A8J3U2T4_9ACTN|nr:TetR/AcrR family transcriptional regulator [Planotetraspora phitsanulokensis]GII35907.1 TetR family transcriptional regulator [Planotetraspora phitsanulokensis]
MEHRDDDHLDQAQVGPSGRVAVPRRRDARRNRELLTALAQEAFAEHGVDASLEQIARKAGLAIGTLYRHFPTRVDLLLAAFEPKLSEFMTAAEATLLMEDPWEGFCTFLEALCATQAGDRGFNDFISMRFPNSQATEAMHDHLCRLASEVIERGQAAGVVRPDITDADIISLVWANSRIIDATRGAAPNAWRRNLHIMIDGFRAAQHPLPEPPLTEAQLYQAMVNLTT